MKRVAQKATLQKLLQAKPRNCPSRSKLHNGDSLEPNTKSNINTQTQAYITSNSEQPNLPAQIQDTPLYHSETIRLRDSLLAFRCNIRRYANSAMTPTTTRKTMQKTSTTPRFLFAQLPLWPDRSTI
ncbi:hypothetical protein PENPOL_c021G02437 [Penicillium polonicum]|uniref:Uncharacterized protein n=1 Tax=Penicillium polonicum TaxID=60169 RepID=A0A1V6N7V7_PENPO|nr:hypothetical protein PENPOL_c021G02437 [Penicillium polonicum]